MAEISVIIPFYNASLYIEEAIRSIGYINDLDVEIIICNDASTDVDINSICCLNDSKVKIIHNKENLGPGISRDRAIDVATGQWIALMDADDAWLPQRLHALWAVAQSTEADVVFDDILMCHDTANGLCPWRRLHGSRAFGSTGEASFIFLENYIKSPRLLIKPMIKKEFLVRNNIFHSERKFAEDAEFFLRLAHSKAKFFYIPKPMYCYRITPGSLTWQAKKPFLMRELIEECSKWPDWSLSERNAFEEKILFLENREEMYFLLKIIKRKQFFIFFKILCKKPYLIKSMIFNSPQLINYQLHRIFHRGNGRGKNS